MVFRPKILGLQYILLLLRFVRFFYVFLRFLKIQKNVTFYVFFALLHTFCRTMPLHLPPPPPHYHITSMTTTTATTTTTTTTTIQYNTLHSENQKIPPLKICSNFSKTVGHFSTKFYTPYCAFISTLDCEFLFNYLQL